MPSGLISTSSGSVSASRISAASLGNGSADRPWKERVQSILSSAGLSSSRGLSDRPVLEMFSVVARFGVGPGTRDAGAPVGVGVEAEVEGFEVELAGVGLTADWLFWFLVVWLIPLLVMGLESWLTVRLGALEERKSCVAFWRVSIAHRDRIRRGADIVACVVDSGRREVWRRG